MLREINGYHLTGDKAGQPLDSYLQMADDGSTERRLLDLHRRLRRRRQPGGAAQARREQSWVAPEWGWAWPANRRILYNRASADPDGKPWSERKAYVWWDEDQQKWTGHDVPDFVADQARRATGPIPARAGSQALAGDDPFIMQADGKGWLFAPAGLLDGPLPAHYEPAESPVRNPFYRQQASPTREVFPRKDNLQNPSPPEPGADVFPYVFTTYRLTEHHTAGGMSRWLPYLSELQPEFFCEVSPELARERGLEHLGWATIVTARTAIEARVLVTDRMVPLRVDDRVVHQIGLPYHWGVGGDALVSGDSANDLFGVTLDPNVHIQESKVASCDIQPGRRPDRPGAAALRRGVPQPGRDHGRDRQRPAHAAGRCGGAPMTDVGRRTPGGSTRRPRKGFFTDTSICIGCKACEVACKEWNGVPDDGLQPARLVLRQHRRARRLAPGGTSRSSSSRKRLGPSGTRAGPHPDRPVGQRRR